MQYLLMIYEDEKGYGADRGGPNEEMMSKHMAFIKELGSAMVGGAGLKTTPSATTVRTAGSAKTVHDGPFAETKEQLGGYYLIDVPDLDTAIKISKMVPLRADGCIEIRPLLTH